MVGLTKPLSVRLADEDAAFLASLSVDDATTSSDKVRALIRLARQRAETPESYAAALGFAQDVLAGPRRVVRAAEGQADVRSDVLASIFAALEDLLALAVAAPAEVGSDGAAGLRKIEQRAVDRAAALSEMLLRWAVTAEAPAYDPHVVTRRIEALRPLMQIVAGAQAPAEEGRKS